MSTKESIVPIMIRNWIQEMLDQKQNSNFRHNRYMSLEYTHRIIGDALKKYEQFDAMRRYEKRK